MFAITKKLIGVLVALSLGITLNAADEAAGDQFAAVLDPLVNQKFIPGYYLSIQKNGEVVYEGSAGTADEDGLKPSSDTIFAIMSMSKPLIALAIVKLVDEGVINFDDPLSKFIPAFRLVNVAPGGLYSNQLQPLSREIVLTDLLTHTSGLTYSSGIVGVGDVSDAYRDLGVMTLESVPDSQWGGLTGQISKLAELPLVAQPGERFIYSVSSDVLGRVIEVVTKMSLAEYMRENIFIPLGMSDTSFYVPETKRARLAQLYSPLTRTYQVPGIPKRYQQSAIVPKDQKNYGLSGRGYESGGAGVVSTAADFSKFMSVVMNRGVHAGSVFVSKENAEKMLRHQLPAQFGPDALTSSIGPGASNVGFSFGLGIFLEEGGDLQDPRTFDYLGWSGAANTSFWIDINKNISGIFLTQHIPTQYNLAPRLENLAESVFGGESAQ